MRLTVQKKLAAKIMKTSPKKVKIDTTRLADVKESITTIDVRGLVGDGVITKKKTSQQSRSNARKIIEQKRKGRRKGTGTRKGRANARLNTKDKWVAKIRAQRAFLKNLKDKGHLDNKAYRSLYRRANGGYFRNVRHIKLYVDEAKQKAQ